MDLVADPRGYWTRTGEAELIGRLAVNAERQRWQTVLADHLSPETLRLVTELVARAAEARGPMTTPRKEDHDHEHL
ncbi:hypothetical protein [Candidatus Nitrospira bockiana]